MNELISIILPCYKAERYLGDMIDDVVAQTYRHWELIVVSNGAGQDAQLAVAQKRADKDSRIKVLTVVKGGGKQRPQCWTARGAGRLDNLC